MLAHTIGSLTMPAIEEGRVLINLRNFHGFYESIHDGLIGDAVNSLFENNDGESCEPDDFHMNFSVLGPVAEAYARFYVDRLQELMASELDINLPSLRMEKLISPREYNFHTDEIVASVLFDELAPYIKTVDEQALRAMVKEQCTTRSGFISFYSSSFDEWKADAEYDYRNFDLQQMGFVFAALADLEEDAIVYDCSERISTLVYDNMSPAARALVDAFDPSQAA